MGTLNRSAMRVLAIASLFAAINKNDTPIFNHSRKGGNTYGGGRRSAASSDAVMFIPKRTKLKGYQKENRRSSFNKKKRAA